MMLNIGQLLEDARAIRETLVESVQTAYRYGLIKYSDPAEDEDVQAIDRIIAYFEERYVPPSEPGSYKQARGILASGVNIDTVFEGGTTCDEPAEVSIRRMRDE